MMTHPGGAPVCELSRCTRGPAHLSLLMPGTGLWIGQVDVAF